MDLPGILSAQSKYLTDLSNNQLNLNSAGVSANLASINSQLGTLNSSLNAGSVTDILSRQSDMQGIIDSENGRLQQKQASIDQAKQGQNRLISLNQSYSKKFSQYTLIMIVGVIALILFLGIILAKQNFPFIPEFFFNILTIVVIASAIIISIIIYGGILSRDNMNYDELALPPPKITTPDQVAAAVAANQAAGNLLGSIYLGSCIGQQCCADGTYWDSSSNTCLPNAAADMNAAAAAASAAGSKQPFTSLGYAYLTNQTVKSNETLPYSTSEFENYAKI